MKAFTCIWSSSLIFLGLITTVSAHTPPPVTAVTQVQAPQTTLFQNVRVFDGRSAQLSAPVNVLIQGNKIQQISAKPITPDNQAYVINGQQKVLMPGLIDAHWHAMLAALPPALMMTADVI